MWTYKIICGYIWTYIDMCGHIWISMDIYGLIYGYIWIYMDIYGYIWTYMDMHLCLFGVCRCCMLQILRFSKELSPRNCLQRTVSKELNKPVRDSRTGKNTYPVSCERRLEWEEIIATLGRMSKGKPRFEFLEQARGKWLNLNNLLWFFIYKEGGGKTRNYELGEIFYVQI